jgi:predicted transposase YbfD/YdcC
LHLVSAWASRQRLVLGQQAIDEKSNEIKAIPHLLTRLELTGALVTIDAMGTQSEIAQGIVDKGGDYCLALKKNHPVLFADVERYFADPTSDATTRAETIDGDHDRIERRIHVVTHTVDWLFSDRRYAGEPKFPNLAMIGMVERITQRGGTTEHTRHYYFCSAKLDAATFGRAVRAHWGVENNLHWVLDVVFHDDLSRLRTANGPENMAVVKHMAMNLMRATTPTASLKVRRKKPPGTRLTSQASSSAPRDALQAIPLAGMLAGLMLGLPQLSVLPDGDRCAAPRRSGIFRRAIVPCLADSEKDPGSHCVRPGKRIWFKRTPHAPCHPHRRVRGEGPVR